MQQIPFKIYIKQKEIHMGKRPVEIRQVLKINILGLQLDKGVLQTWQK